MIYGNVSFFLIIIYAHGLITIFLMGYLAVYLTQYLTSAMIYVVSR